MRSAFAGPATGFCGCWDTCEAHGAETAVAGGLGQDRIVLPRPPPLIGNLAVLVEDLSSHAVVPEQDGRSSPLLGNLNAEEASLDPVKGLDLGIATRGATGVLVARRAARKFPEASCRIHREVLPMPVPTTDEEVCESVLLGPVAEVISLGRERRV